MSHVRLTLSCPRAVGGQIAEHLLDSPLLAHGFVTLDASGHGGDFAGASLREKVRGQVDALLLVALLPAGDVASLLAFVRERFHGAQIRYWTEPVLAFGDFV